MDTIFILGDSTSMTVGLERKSYPFIMADQKVWRNGTEILNCSQPGFTSSDACAFFFRHINSAMSPKAVIIYLGNCDANATEIAKGRYTPLRQYRHRIKELFCVKKRRISLKNKLTRFEWNDSYDPAIEREEEPSDFQFNISRIVRYCKRHSILVLLIRPVANLLFPSGLGKGNFIFYKYLNIEGEFASLISIPDKRFIDALRLREKGAYAEAMKVYKKILEDSHRYLANPEYDLIVVNNYAVSAAESGNFEEAEKLLGLLLKERNVRKEIVLFNLAQLYKNQNDMKSYAEFLKESYETDSSLYRVKDKYLDAIDRIAPKFSGSLSLVDMREFAGHSLFIDHCHLVSDGQKTLAEKIVSALTKARVTVGDNTAKIKNILYNPELAIGDTTGFYEYYKTYAPYSSEEIRKDIDTIRKLSSGSDETADPKEALQAVSKEMRLSFEHYLRHPVFPSIQDILHFAPEYPSDIGRFPEFFLIRHIVPYLRIAEKESSLSGRFSMELGLLHPCEDLIALLPAKVVPLISSEDPIIDTAYEEKRLEEILLKVKRDLIANLRLGNQVYERLKTTIFWYFRETLRWGSHSRISMRYDRLFLEYCAEALALAGVLDYKLGWRRKDDILLAISWMEKADRIHSKYAERFSLESDYRALLEEYDRALLGHAETIEKTSYRMTYEDTKFAS